MASFKVSSFTTGAAAAGLSFFPTFPLPSSPALFFVTVDQFFFAASVSTELNWRLAAAEAENFGTNLNLSPSFVRLVYANSKEHLPLSPHSLHFKEFPIYFGFYISCSSVRCVVALQSYRQSPILIVAIERLISRGANRKEKSSEWRGRQEGSRLLCISFG